MLENGLSCPRLAKHPLDLASALWLVERRAGQSLIGGAPTLHCPSGGPLRRWATSLFKSEFKSSFQAYFLQRHFLLARPTGKRLRRISSSYWWDCGSFDPIEGKAKWENKVSHKQTDTSTLLRYYYNVIARLRSMRMPRTSSFCIRDILDLPRPKEKCGN